MPQKPIPSTTLAAAVRQYLGLSQEQLAVYLGVSRGQVAHVEAGRRQLRARSGRLLQELAARLPPPLGLGAVVYAVAGDELATPQLATKALQRQQAKCRWQLANLRVQLAQLEARVELAHRWRALLAAEPELPHEGSEADVALRKQLLQEWAITAADVLQPNAATNRQLLMLRIRMLETEIVALEELLAGLAAAKPLSDK